MSKAIINGYELEDDGQGNLIIREKSTGEEITVDGSTIEQLDVGEFSINGDNAAPLMKSSIIVPRLDDGIYPISNYADLFDALNQALTDLDAAGSSGATQDTIRLPPLGSHTVESGKVTIPLMSGDGVSPAIVGPSPSNGGLRIKIGSNFPDPVAIDTETDGTGKSDEQLKFKNFDLRDENGVITDSLMHITNRWKGIIRDVKLYANHNNLSHYLNIDAQNNGADDFWRLDNVDIRNLRSNVTGLRFQAGQLYATGIKADGNGTSPNSGATAFDVGGQSVGNYLSGFLGSGLDVGVRVREQPGSSRNGWGEVKMRAEGGKINTPYLIEDMGGARITPLGNDQFHWRNAEDYSPLTKWVSPHVDVVETGTFHGGGASLPASFAASTDCRTDTQSVKVEGTSGSDALLENATDILSGPGGTNLEDYAPKLSLWTDYDDRAGAVYRAGIVESKWTDWAGIYIDTDGTNTYHLRVVEGGTIVKDVDTGVGRSGQGEFTTIKLGPGNNVTIGWVTNATSTEASERMSATLSSQFDSAQVAFDLTNTSSGIRTLEVHKSKLQQGLPNETL